MSRAKNYIFNEQTESYEIDRRSARSTLYRAGAILLSGLALFVLYYIVFTGKLGVETPKALLLERRNRNLRDNLVYRPVFGMEELGPDVRDAALGGEERYASFLGLDHQQLMTTTARRLDLMTRRAYAQSLSFDEVKVFSGRAGDIASCIPSIYPVNPRTVQLTSPFGARFHPIRGAVVFHEGVDLAGPAGQNVYATGDGVVESAEVNFHGYGNVIVIDHGFGYKTRYAHLRDMRVTAGQVVIRGDKIGTLGSSGLSTGPHLHYEVIYRGQQINPWNYLNPDVSPEEYSKMVRNG